MKKYFGRISPRSLSIVLLAILTLLAASYVRSSKASPKSPDASLGVATVSGTVHSPADFKAGKVYFTNTDRNMTYMVYTTNGRYKAMHLWPGNYDVSVQAKGLESDVQKMMLKAGENTTEDVTLHEATASNVEMVPFTELYPAGLGREIAQRTCIRCHGPNFLPSKRWAAPQWKAAIAYMQSYPMFPASYLTPEDLPAFVDYLVANFGPNSKPRLTKMIQEMPIDETKISQAEYIEYYFPVDGPNEGINDPQYADAQKSNPFGHKRTGQDPQFDGQGNIWVTDRGTPNRIVRLDPRTGEFKQYVTVNPTRGIHDLNVDRDGMVYSMDNECSPTNMCNLNIFDPKTEKWVSSYNLDPDHKLTIQRLRAQAVQFDTQGNAYIGFIQGSGLARWEKETQKVTTWVMPPDAWPYGVVRDSKDNMWISEFHRNNVSKFDTTTQAFTEYTPPTSPNLIRRLSVDSNDNVWFGLFSGGKLERLDSKTGKITEWTIPHENSQPYDIKESHAAGGKMWFSDAGQGGALILFDPKTANFTYYPGPQQSDMPKIRVAKDGSVWYSPRSGRKAGIGVLYPDKNKITLAAMPADPWPYR